MDLCSFLSLAKYVLLNVTYSYWIYDEINYNFSAKRYCVLLLMLIRNFRRALNQHIESYQVDNNCPLLKGLICFMAVAYCIKGHVWQNISIDCTLCTQSLYQVFNVTMLKWWQLVDKMNHGMTMCYWCIFRWTFMDIFQNM